MTAQLDLFAVVAEPLREPAPTYSAVKEDQPKEWRFTWRGLHVIGTAGPCFAIDKAKHPEGTRCWSHTGFRSFCGDAWRLAGTSNGRSISEWSVAILDAYFAAPAKDGNGLGGQLVPWERQMWDRDDDDESADDPAEEAPPAPAPRHDDPQAEREFHPLHQALMDAGLISSYHAVCGATFQDPQHKDRGAPWNAPSRLFLFPCALHLPVDEEPRLLIWTERLAEHPYVADVARVTGLVPEVDDGGFDAGFHASHALYHHAVDLISEGQWQQLLDLRDFTDSESIVSAVNYGLTYAHLKPCEAMSILNAIGVSAPVNPSPVDALRVCSLSEFKGEDGKPRRAVNFMHGPGSDANVWALLAGIERGWFVHNKQGYMRWTDKALAEQRNLKAAAGEKVAAAPVPEGCLL